MTGMNKIRFNDTFFEFLCSLQLARDYFKTTAELDWAEVIIKSFFVSLTLIHPVSELKTNRRTHRLSSYLNNYRL